MSGSLQEFVNHYLEPLELLDCGQSQAQSHGQARAQAGGKIRQWRREAMKVVKIQRMQPQSLRSLFSFSVMAPSAIGFLAYEYGKEILLAKDEE